MPNRNTAVNDMTSSENTAVSIIIPTHNRRHTIRRALRSALRQTISPKEIIVIDDGSSDNTKEIVKRIIRRHPEIHLIANPHNLGSGESRNIGIGIASGEFISFLDSDDIYPDRESLKRMYDLAKQNEVAICGSLRELKIGWKIIKTDDFREECRKSSERFVLEYTDYQQDYDFTSYIFKRSLLIEKDIKFPSYRRYQDVPFFVNCMIKSEKFCVAPICGYRYTIDKKRPVVYNDRNTEDLIKGITETICIASENGLPLLLIRTVGRLNDEYRKVIISNYERGNKKILILLKEADDAINRDLDGCENLSVTLIDDIVEKQYFNTKC